ncbi:hypothetical protein AVEN_106988-1 [Araneus ventricosus]|uniref:Uncharacterized protein n=1 Tax=Araneus ventricosus TaxID=182803 RepID=A0A4Y2R8M0_ARAVE|nr:hypothetical protein AVEN_106988-1 [Araneus ventricosus]
MKCSFLTSCRICGPSNTPALIFPNDRLGNAEMRYLKQSPSIDKALTNCFMRPSFICRGGNIMFFLSTSVALPATHSPVTTAGDILPQSVVPIGEAASVSQDLSDFQIVSNKKKIKKETKLKKNNQNTTAEKISKYYKTPPLKDSVKRSTDIKQTSKFWNTSPRQVSTSTALQKKTSDSRHDTNALTALNVGIDSNSVVQTAPESKGVPSSVRTQELHSLDPDTEMRTSSSSEDDILEYEMSEELEETSSDSVCTPSPPRPKKYIIPTKYKQK